MQTLESAGYDSSRLIGSALNRYAEDYAQEHVVPALDRLARQKPLDPDDISGRNTLRNKAEMAVRYQGHMDQIADMRNKGIKLAIVSAHADCSVRCSSAQGQVVSLDGTYGTTDDGRSYRPLEYYTDVTVRTKAGVEYKNGLFGFNCRHYLVPYKRGYRFPKPNPAVERAQYDITEEQRRLENEVRKWRTKAITYKGQNPKKYKEAKRRAEEWNKRYIEYSEAHNRAYYPSRTKIL